MPAAAGRAAVREFDRYLGDPDDAATKIPTARSLELDERSAFPREAIEAIDDWGLQRWYAPAQSGGELRDVLVPMMMIRAIARRDLTPAVAHGKTFLGAVSAWIAGGPAAGVMAGLVLHGGPVSWGLTERGRGSDLSNTTTTAGIGAGGITLDGVKWPINNATRGRAVTVLARSSDVPGPRALSLVILDKQRVDAATLELQPKVLTHGLRGTDMSGIGMRATVVEPELIVGEAGHGLELVLKGLQLTRPMTAALSMGAADHGLAIATEFAATRRITGGRLADLPIVRSTLGAAVADVLLAEAVMYAGAREAHHAPNEMALVSALAKYLGSETVDLMFRDLAQFLGTDSQLVDSAGAGAFQKANRDNRAVGIFDGNSIVCLNVIVNEFTAIAREAEPVDAADLVRTHRLDAVLEEELLMTRLRLVTRRGSRMLRALPSLVEMLGARASAAPARRISDELARLVEIAGRIPPSAMPSPGAFDVANRIAHCFGASCVIALVLGSADSGGERTELRLRAVLERLAARLGLADPGPLWKSTADLADDALMLGSDRRRVSLLEEWETAS
ncbi:MAG TPA: acyl-CoA dehydrogenase [Agromyces sp.]|nr:acyl-CoA dehydrogenase [Agromyces sp.]